MSWLDDYANTASQFVDAPRLFQRVAAYWTLGAAVGKRVYYQFGMVPIYPNMFLVFVGLSGAVKKSLTKDFALNVLDHAVGEIDLPGRGSPEAFRDSLNEHDWYGVLHFDEFHEFLTKRRKDYTQDMDVTIMELFAHGRKSPIRTKTSGEIRIPNSAVISFIAPTTIDFLLAGLKRDDLMSGKMARFLMVEADQDIEYPVPPPMPATVQQYIGTKLRGLIPNVANPVPMKETPQARAMLEAFYYGIKERIATVGNPCFSSSFSRAQVYALKLAMIHALAHGRMTIEEDDYTAIQPIITNWADCLSKIVEKMAVEDRFQEQLAKAERFLKDHPTTTQRDLQKYMKVRKYEMADIMNHLIESGTVEAITDTSFKGRVILKYTQNPNGNGEQEALPPCGLEAPVITPKRKM